MNMPLCLQNPSPANMAGSTMTPTTAEDRRMLASLAPMAAVDLNLFLRLMLLKMETPRDPMAKVHREKQEHLTKHRLVLTRSNIEPNRLRRVTAPSLVQWLEALDGMWRPHKIVFESNGAFDAVRELLVRHAAFGAKVVGVKQSRSKVAQFARFAVMVQNGAFRLCGDGSQEKLHREMTKFPFSQHDDLYDAAATGMNYLLQLQCEPRIWDFAA